MGGPSGVAPCRVTRCLHNILFSTTWTQWNSDRRDNAGKGNAAVADYDLSSCLMACCASEGSATSTRVCPHRSRLPSNRKVDTCRKLKFRFAEIVFGTAEIVFGTQGLNCRSCTLVSQLNHPSASPSSLFPPFTAAARQHGHPQLVRQRQVRQRIG